MVNVLSDRCDSDLFVWSGGTLFKILIKSEQFWLNCVHLNCVITAADTLRLLLLMFHVKKCPNVRVHKTNVRVFYREYPEEVHVCIHISGFLTNSIKADTWDSTRIEMNPNRNIFQATYIPTPSDTTFNFPDFSAVRIGLDVVDDDVSTLKNACVCLVKASLLASTNLKKRGRADNLHPFALTFVGMLTVRLLAYHCTWCGKKMSNDSVGVCTPLCAVCGGEEVLLWWVLMWGHFD